MPTCVCVCVHCSLMLLNGKLCLENTDRSSPSPPPPLEQDRISTQSTCGVSFAIWRLKIERRVGFRYFTQWHKGLKHWFQSLPCARAPPIGEGWQGPQSLIWKLWLTSKLWCMVYTNTGGEWWGFLPLVIYMLLRFRHWTSPGTNEMGKAYAEHKL